MSRLPHTIPSTGSLTSNIFQSQEQNTELPNASKNKESVEAVKLKCY